MKTLKTFFLTGSLGFLGLLSAGCKPGQTGSNVPSLSPIDLQQVSSLPGASNTPRSTVHSSDSTPVTGWGEAGSLEDGLPGEDGSEAPSAGKDRSKRAVVLVHGWLMSGSSMQGMKSYLEAQGIPNVFTIDLPGRGAGKRIEKFREYLSKEIQALQAKGIEQVDLVGHSMGGLVIREYVRTKGEGAPAVPVLITVATPNEGNGGGLGGLKMPGFLGKALDRTAETQMAPGSGLLERLNTSGTPLGTQAYGVWTSKDNIVRPAKNCKLRGAQNFQVEGLGFMPHGAIVRNEKSLRVIHHLLLGKTPPSQS